MSKRRKKSKYKNAVVGKKKYYFYKIRWIEITGDAGHKNEEEMDKLECCTMISQGYIYKIDKKKILKRLSEISCSFTEIKKR